MSVQYNMIMITEQPMRNKIPDNMDTTPIAQRLRLKSQNVFFSITNGMMPL